MKAHRCKLIAHHKTLTSQGVKDRLEASNTIDLKDGIDIARVMRGRSRSRNFDDETIQHLFKKGWCFNIKKLTKHIKPTELSKLRKLGSTTTHTSTNAI